MAIVRRSLWQGQDEIFRPSTPQTSIPSIYAQDNARTVRGMILTTMEKRSAGSPRAPSFDINASSTDSYAVLREHHRANNEPIFEEVIPPRREAIVLNGAENLLRRNSPEQ